MLLDLVVIQKKNNIEGTIINPPPIPIKLAKIPVRKPITIIKSITDSSISLFII